MLDTKRPLWALVVFAFAIRLLARLAGGDASFFENSYYFYVRIATTFVHGGGLCTAPGVACALRVPVYPLFLSPFVATGSLFPALPLVQSAIGAGLVWLTWKIGTSIFDQRTGLLAAAMATLSPYAIVHDTRLQDTVLLNALVALAIYWLLRLRRSDSRFAALGAGIALSLAVLTTARVALLLPLALVWTGVAAGATWRVRARHAILIALPAVLLVGGWLVRNWRDVGAPVLTTEAGESLWAANSPWTFSSFPAQSIDLTVGESYARLSAAEQARLARLRGQDVARDRLLGRWGLQYIAAHPLTTLRNGARKVWVALAAELSPSRSPLLDAGYRLVYAPVHLLAAIGLWRARRDGGPHSLVYLLLLSFVLTTGVFWAHTSHKSYLDVFLFVYAASALGIIYDTARARWVR